MLFKFLILCSFQIAFSLGSDLSYRKPVYSLELYFCISINPISSYKFQIQNATLQSGKWTEGRYSNKEIKLENTTLIENNYTLCAKKRDNYEYGPVGRLGIKVSGGSLIQSLFNLYVWWDMAILENQDYGFDYDYRKSPKPEIRKLDKNWIRVLDNIPS